MVKLIEIFENHSAERTYVLKAGTVLFHRRWVGEEWNISELRFPAWFAFDLQGTATASVQPDDPQEVVKFVTTRDVILMDGEDDEIQDLYDEGVSIHDIAEIPRERGYAGWMIPNVEVLLNEPSLVKPTNA